MLVKLLVYCDLVKHVLEPLLDDKSMLSGVGVLSKSFRSLATDYRCIHPYSIAMLGFIKHRKFTAIKGDLTDFCDHARCFDTILSFGITQMFININQILFTSDTSAIPRGITHVILKLPYHVMSLDCLPDTVTHLMIYHHAKLKFINFSTSVKELTMVYAIPGLSERFPAVEKFSSNKLVASCVPRSTKRVFTYSVYTMNDLPPNVEELHITDTNTSAELMAEIPSHIKLLTVAGRPVNLRKRNHE